MNLAFYEGKSVFVTGYSGFKGAWLCYLLKRAGAMITGYALDPKSGSVFEGADISYGISSKVGDIRDFDALNEAFQRAEPEIVFHLAAQPLVLESYSRPSYTFETNVMGTVNLLECVRKCKTVHSIIIVTTDKVYKNNEWVYGYREIDALGGSDPYAASKSCSEIITESYRASFLQDVPLSTARAGNVIGGGDVSTDRIIPDCIRAAKKGEPIIVRNPYSIRPYQHVLEPLYAYLLIAQRQSENPELAGSYNIGPTEADCITTGELADVFCREWGGDQSWVNACERTDSPRESNLLRLDSSKMRSTFNWRSVWNVREAIAKTVEWEKTQCNCGNVCAIMEKQVGEYLSRWRW